MATNTEDMVAQLTEAREKCRRLEREIDALRENAHTQLESRHFDQAVHRIFHRCRRRIGASAGYVAQIDPGGHETRWPFVEFTGLSDTSLSRLSTTIREIRSEVCHTLRGVYENDFAHHCRPAFAPRKESPIENVLVAPLPFESEAIGVLILVNKPGGFNPGDTVLAEGFGEFAAICLHHRQIIEDQRLQTEDTEARQTLEMVRSKMKTLKRPVSICAWCKRIREDSGRWSDMETYFHRLADTRFSHGICPECMDRVHGEEK